MDAYKSESSSASPLYTLIIAIVDFKIIVSYFSRLLTNKYLKGCNTMSFW